MTGQETLNELLSVIMKTSEILTLELTLSLTYLVLEEKKVFKNS